MARKIFLSIILITICALAVSTVTVFAVTNSYYDRQIIAELSKEADFVCAGYETSGAQYLESLRNGKTRITLISSDGTVIFDNKADPLTMGNHLERQEIAEALKNGTGHSSRHSDTLSEKTNYYAKRLSTGEVLRVSGVQYSRFAVLSEIVSPIFSIAVLVLLAGTAAAITLSRKIVAPIIEMDVENPEKNGNTYRELRPVIDKLAEQKRRIGAQISELQIRQSEFEAITSNMSEGMIIVDCRASILSCNHSAEKILGLEHPLPQSALTLGDGAAFTDALLSSLSGVRYEGRLKKEGSVYSLIATPVLEDSNVCGAVIVLLDETEKEHRENLRREFTSNVSHELKTPLTSISGYAELIRDRVAVGEQSVIFADKICKESGRMIALIGDIIKLSQLDGREIPFDKTRIDLYELALEVTERLDSLARKNKVSLCLEGQPCFIEGNANIVEDMIYNLCDNAIKYNREGGFVKVTVGNDENSHPFFSVQDNGIGIPSSEQERIFERFYRVDKSHSRHIGGTGLGLSIVKHAALYHNASVSVESRVGQGTAITVRFEGLTQI